MVSPSRASEGDSLPTGAGSVTVLLDADEPPLALDDGDVHRAGANGQVEDQITGDTSSLTQWDDESPAEDALCCSRQ